MARQTAAFLVRMWAEDGERGDAGPPEWRGSVVHLVSRERRYFTEIVELAAFLTAYVGYTEDRVGDPDA